MGRRKSLRQAIAPALLLPLGLAPLGAQALGLGTLRVDSALGQPLSARIDLVGATAAEAEVATVRLASPDTQARLGASNALGGVMLRFEVKVSGDGRPYVAVSSNQPVSEPYVEFVVEAVSPTGQVARHYTVLLDPVGAPASPSPAAAWASPSPGWSAAAPAPVSRPRSNPFANVGAPRAGAVFGPVPPGTTLWAIARRVRPGGADLDAVMSAILRANPNAFINGDPARLLAGSRLTIPQVESLQEQVAAAPSSAEPAPPTDTSAPVEAPAAPAPAAADAEPATPAPAASGTETADKPGDSQAATGEVRVLRGEDAGAAGQAAPDGVSPNRAQLLEEALDAAQQQNEAIERRMKALEEQVRTLSELAKSSSTGEPGGTGLPAGEAPAVAQPPVEASPAVPTAVTPSQDAPIPAPAVDEEGSGARIYGLAALAGVALGGLLLWARRRRAAAAADSLEPTPDEPTGSNAGVVPQAPAPAIPPAPPVPMQDPPVAAASPAAPAAVVDAPGVDAHVVDDGFGDPVDTQIDLLTAYVGMADGPSARQIHDEIQRTGNAAQKAQAAALMARLDA